MHSAAGDAAAAATALRGAGDDLCSVAVAVGLQADAIGLERVTPSDGEGEGKVSEGVSSVAGVHQVLAFVREASTRLQVAAAAWRGARGGAEVVLRGAVEVLRGGRGRDGGDFESRSKSKDQDEGEDK